MLHNCQCSGLHLQRVYVKCSGGSKSLRWVEGSLILGKRCMVERKRFMSLQSIYLSPLCHLVVNSNMRVKRTKCNISQSEAFAEITPLYSCRSFWSLWLGHIMPRTTLRSYLINLVHWVWWHILIFTPVNAAVRGIKLATRLSPRRCRRGKQSEGDDYLWVFISWWEPLEKHAILFLDSLWQKARWSECVCFCSKKTIHIDSRFCRWIFKRGHIA